MDPTLRDSYEWQMGKLVIHDHDTANEIEGILNDSGLFDVEYDVRQGQMIFKDLVTVDAMLHSKSEKKDSINKLSFQKFGKKF